MRQERMRDADGQPVAFDAEKVVTVVAMQSAHSQITFVNGTTILVQGSFDTIASRIWPPDPLPI